MSLDIARIRQTVAQQWRNDITPALLRYIAIPAVSESFDQLWAEHGHIDAAVELVAAWCRDRRIPGLRVEVIRLAGRTPMVVCEIPATGPGLGDVLVYGHLDKQPEMVGWRAGLGAWSPVIEGERLYGRGSADDGYAAFASLTAIESLDEQGVAHARCVVLIEASEESGSPDLPAYVEALVSTIGSPSLVLCLDSGCATYDQLWVTSSLRGMCRGQLHVEVLTEGVHSGDAGGLVPSSFRIARLLLSRIEDQTTGRLLVPELHAPTPPARRNEAEQTARQLGADWAAANFPFAGSTQPAFTSTAEALMARTWEPSLEVTGAAGLPSLEQAGNVLRPSTTLMLAIRLPPTVDAAAAATAVERVLTADPPHGAVVRYKGDAQQGWVAPDTAPWLESALDRAARAAFNRPAGVMGEGGTIPFMGMLGRQFPDAQFVITGVLGPESNAHGPNEFLHLPTAEGLTTALAVLLFEHAGATSPQVDDR